MSGKKIPVSVIPVEAQAPRRATGVVTSSRQSQAYRDAHKDEKRAYDLVYGPAHPEANRQKQQRYYAKHAETVRVRHLKRDATPEGRLHRQGRTHRYQALKRGADLADFTGKEWRAMCKAAGYRCAYCHKKFPFKELTQDHITPLSKGGSHTLRNIIPACVSCNSRKHTKDVLCPVQPFLLVADAATD